LIQQLAWFADVLPIVVAALGLVSELSIMPRARASAATEGQSLRRVFTLLMLGFAMNCAGKSFAGDEIEIASQAYKISLPKDWIEQKALDPEQRTFFSKEKDTALVISAMSINARMADTERVARKMLEFRLQAENRAAQSYNLRMTIAEPIVVASPWGHVMAYYGSDSSGRQFSYSGAVTPKVILSVFVESRSRSELQLKTILDALLERLELVQIPK